MNIEKLEENPHHSYANEMHTKKINEIIDKLQSRELLDSFVTITLPDLIKHLENTFESAKTFDDRLTNLEQCPINDVRQCQPPKPDYDPDDVKLNRELPIDDILNAIIDDVEYLYKEFGLMTEPTAAALNNRNIGRAEQGTFEWAIIQMKQGKTLRRKNQFGYHHIFNPKNPCTFYINTQELFADDWEIVK